MCQLGTVIAGDSATVTYSFYPNREGQITMHSVASSSIADFDLSNNEVTQVTPIIPHAAQADLYVVATTDSATVTVGDPVTFVVDVRNRGGAEAPASRLTGRSPERTTAWIPMTIRTGPARRSDIPDVFQCDLGTIAPGGHATVRIQVTPLEQGYLNGVLRGEDHGARIDPV